MKIIIKGEMSLAEIRQALFEKFLEIEDECAVHHSRGATLYLNPTNGSGNTVIPHNKSGRKIETILSDGPYRSAADDKLDF